MYSLYTRSTGFQNMFDLAMASNVQINNFLDMSDRATTSGLSSLSQKKTLVPSEYDLKVVEYDVKPKLIQIMDYIL